MEYASNAKGNTGVALGAVGTGMGVLSAIGNLVNAHANMDPEETPVSRHELNYVQELANKDHTIAKLEGQMYTDAAIKGLSDQLAVKFNQIDQTLNSQAVYNATLNGTVTCIQNQVTQLNNLVGKFTQVIIPNTSVMPGWGDVTITPSGSATVKGAIPSGS